MYNAAPTSKAPNTGPSVFLAPLWLVDVEVGEVEAVLPAFALVAVVFLLKELVSVVVPLELVPVLEDPVTVAVSLLESVRPTMPPSELARASNSDDKEA